MQVLRLVLCVGVVLVGNLGWLSNGQAQEVPVPESQGNSPRKTEAYIAPYLLGTLPVDRNLSVGGNGVGNTPFSGTNIQGSAGGGLKAGVYPGVMGGAIGLEGEVFGHGGKLKTPGGAFPSADANLLVINSMINLLLRYPGDMIQPYVGAGAGVSYAQLRDLNLQTNVASLSGKGSDAAFAYQFLAGARAYMNKQLYLFGEYKYFGSAYDWKSESSSGGSGPTTSLTFRTHIVAAGFGITF